MESWLAGHTSPPGGDIARSRGLSVPCAKLNGQLFSHKLGFHLRYEKVPVYLELSLKCDVGMLSSQITIRLY